MARVLLGRTGCGQAASGKKVYGQVASGKMKRAVMLLLWRTRVMSGCFWGEHGSGQVASGKNKGAVRLLLVRTWVWSGCFSEGKDAVRLLVEQEKGWSQ